MRKIHSVFVVVDLVGIVVIRMIFMNGFVVRDVDHTVRGSLVRSCFVVGGVVGGCFIVGSFIVGWFIVG